MDPRPERQLPTDRQRRIGERYQVAIDLTWFPTPVSRWKRRPKPMHVTSDNLSVSGLGFLGDAIDEVRIGCLVTLTIGDVTGQAVIRLVKPAATEGQAYYGVEFRDAALENEARLLVSDLLEAEGKPRTVAVAGDTSAPYRPDMSAWS